MFKKYCFEGGNCHNFQPRYEEARFLPNNLESIDNASSAIIDSFKEYHKIHIRDVCVYCGKEIERKNKAI